MADVNFTGRPKKTEKELEELYPTDLLLIIEDALSNKKMLLLLLQDLIDIMKYGFEKEEVRKRIMYYKFKKSDKEQREMQLNHLISNLIFWMPLIDVDAVEVLDESWIFDFSKFNSNTLLEYVNTKLLPIYDTDFKSQNIMVDELYHYIISISHAFCLLMGMSVSLYDLHQLELRDPEIAHLIRDGIDESLEPHEVEQVLEERNNRLISKLINDPIGNDYKPLLASGNSLKKAQFREYIVRIGFKADINGNTVPILIDNNFLLHGLNKPSFVYLNAISGRKALILSKLSMGVPGAMSRRISFSSLTSTLREDLEPCDSVIPVTYHINDDEFLSKLDGRYYYDARGNMKYLDYNKDKHLIGKYVRFRSPCTCNSKEGVCKYCYGHMFRTNQSLNSAGVLAALKITEPIGQGVLSSKHSQSTSSNELKFTDGFEDVFDITSSMVSLRSDSELDADLYLRLGDVEIEEMDDSEYYSVTSFDLLNEKGELLRHIEEESGAKFYLNDSLIMGYKQKIRSRTQEMIFSLDDIDEDENLFTIEVKNKELTEPIKVFTKILDTKDHGGNNTIDEMCQSFAEKLMLLGIRYEFVHMEMIVRSLIRKKTNILEFPDFSTSGNPNDWQILKLSEAQKEHPSVLVSLPYGYLRKQLLSPNLYKKTQTGPLDPLYISQLSMYL